MYSLVDNFSCRISDNNWAENISCDIGHEELVWLVIELTRLAINPVEIGKRMDVGTHKVIHHYEQREADLVLYKEKAFRSNIVQYTIHLEMPHQWFSLMRFTIH